jgi:FKBP-type peptidyl-prolyl cis-trans isomerase
LSENSGVSIPVPEGHQLQITQVCLDLDTETTGPVILRAKSTNDEQEFNVCILHAKSHHYHAQLNLEFGPEDSPVEFSVDGGAVHLTGNWRWEDDHEHGSECGGGSDEDDDDEEEEEDMDIDDEEDEEPPELVPFPSEEEKEEEVEEVPVKKSSKKAKNQPKPEKEGKEKKNAAKDKETSVSSDNKRKREAETPAAAAQQEQPPAKKAAKNSEPKTSNNQASSTFSLPTWHVIPETDTGILVPKPKSVTKKDGLIVTDYMIGKGALPKPGAVVEILYEGLFPETGEVFDHRLKRKQPFTFRRGLQHVIKGMDLGMEGMRVGGAREMIIPPQLGYGSKGIGEIPGNQTLVFRIQLIGTH